MLTMSMQPVALSRHVRRLALLWQNMINPAFQPAKKSEMRKCTWLASSTDAWVRGLRRDTTGTSGDFVGQELDARLVLQVAKNFDIDLAYAHFFPGEFVASTRPSPPSDFIQIAGTLRF